MSETVLKKGAGHHLVYGAVSAAGVGIIYALWLSGHPYLGLGAALIGAVASINHYLLSRQSGGATPYWVFFLPVLAYISTYALLRDLFGAAALAYVIVAVIALAYPSSATLVSVLGDAVATDARATAVLGAAAVSGLSYVFVYGDSPDTIGLWAMAGPLLEYFLVKWLSLSLPSPTNRYAPARTLLFSTAASLMFLPPISLGTYAVLANFAKAMSKGRYATAAMVVDYLIRASVLVLTNIGRITLPAGEILGVTL